MLGHDDHAVCADQLACGWFVGSSQVELVIGRAAWLLFTHQVVIFSLTDHLAAMGDGLHVILILVARLIQGILVERGQEELFINIFNNRVGFFCMAALLVLFSLPHLFF